jgi:hypothetical protein
LGLKLAGLMLILMIAMGGVGYWYYTDTQKTMRILVANEAKATLAAKTAEAATKAIQENLVRVQEQLQKVNAEFAESRQNNKILSKKLGKYDLATMGEENPPAVQRMINAATKRVSRCFELESGSKLTEREKNAKSGREFNRECPWLWPGTAKP